MCCATLMQGQESKDSISLQTVTVRADQVVNTVDGKKYYPTAKVKETSTNAYSLLSKLALPKVQVNETTQTISTPELLGNLQIRINDIVASEQELAALNPKAVRYVQYIDKPGARYGDDVGIVINLVVNRPDSGYDWGGQAMQVLTSEISRVNLYGRYNKGKDEWSVGYKGMYEDLRGARNSEEAHYIMENSDMNYVMRKDLSHRQEDMQHNVELKYSRQDSCGFTMQAKLDIGLDRTLKDHAVQEIVSGKEQYSARSSNGGNTQSPMLNFYMAKHWTRHQSLTVDAVGTLMDSKYKYEYAALTPFRYNATGHSASFVGETVYENVLKPFTLSAGVNCRQKFTRNRYFNNASTQNGIHNHSLYTFVQISGNLFSRLKYQAGMGLDRTYYRQADTRYDLTTLRPRINLSIPISQRTTLAYNMTYGAKMPRLEYLGNFRNKENEWDVVAGNPSLKPDYPIHNTWTLSYQNDKLYSQLTAHYRYIDQCCMQDIRREKNADGKEEFVFTQSNQRNIQMFYLDGYAQVFAIPDKLQVSADGGFYRFWNMGDMYRHTYNAFNGSFSATAFLGKWTLSCYWDSGWSFMEGESRNKGNGAFYMTGNYQLNRQVTLGIFWQHCLDKNITAYHTQLLNRFVHKEKLQRNRDMGNMVTVSLNWRFSRGKTYKTIEKSIENEDTDTGIIKKSEK